MRTSLILLFNNTLFALRSEVEADQALLLKTKDELTGRLHAEPQVQDCIRGRDLLHEDILSSKCEVAMWHHRLSRLQELHQEIKPVYEYELIGRFNPQTFPLEASLSLHSSVGRNTPGALGGTSSHPRSRVSSSAHSLNSGSLGGGLSVRADSPLAGLDISVPPPTSPSMKRRKANDHPSDELSDEGSPGGGASLKSMTLAEQQRRMHTLQAPMALKQGELEELMTRDPTLAAALLPLRGHESHLLTAQPPDQSPGGGGGAASGGGKSHPLHHNHKPPLKGTTPGAPGAAPAVNDRDQNMTAWITLRVSDCYYN